MAISVLIVEDDPNIRELLQLYLEKDGYAVTLASDGGQGLEKFRAIKPDLVLLDVMMPVMDGWEVCKAIRAQGDTPVIMLTAKSETDDKVLGLKVGADDYVTKPFEMKELLARIEAVLRRSDRNVEENKARRLVFDKLTIDMDAFELIVDGKKVDTPPKEMELLFYLASSPNRVYTRNQLWMRCGALTISATPGPWTSTSNVCGKNWRAFPKNGASRPSGALGINLKFYN